MEARDLEVMELRRRVARLKEEARKNEDAWKRSQAREMELLEADRLATWLERITEGLRQSYQLASVTLVLADHDHEIRHLLMSQGAIPDSFTAVRFVDTGDALVRRYSPRRGPWLGPFCVEDHGSLFPSAQGIRSVALLPLMRQERVVGSLNLGSDDANRFTQQHAIDFLYHLAVIAAFSLENTVNRARLVRSGFTDALTGWHNRRYLQTRLREEVARTSRDRTALVCLMIDADHFKNVNDRYGHLAGDEVLSQLARRISSEVRGSDVSARYGGEEFVILLPGTGMQAGHALAERIRLAVAAAPFDLATLGESLPITVSIGVAEYRPSEHGDDTTIAGEQLIARADRALYQAKAQGRNVVALASG